MRRHDAVVASLALACLAAGNAIAQCQDPASTPGRFVVRGVELVDTQTNLVWLRCAAGYVPRAQCDASAVLPAQTFEGAARPVGGAALPPGEWRLPTVGEWETIIARNCKYLVDPKNIDISFDKVWTATPAGADRVYTISLSEGRVASPRKLASDDYAQAFYVRAARPEDLSPAAPATAPGQSAAPAQPAYTKADLQKMYNDYLVTEGFNPQLTQAGNILFRREGRTFVLYVDEKDPTYFRLALAFSYDDQSPNARLIRLDAANVAAEQTKVVKVYVGKDGSVTFAAEMFLATPGDVRSEMPRVFRTIDYAYDKYRARLAELAGGG